VALLTKTIATQTVAIHGSITAVVARRAADTAALQSQVQLAAVEVQRTRKLQLWRTNHLARQELNSATTRQAVQPQLCDSLRRKLRTALH
jgi:hypothetical protein